MTSAEALARLRLSRTEGIGPATFRRLLARHGTAAAALDALPAHAARSGRAFAPPPLAEVEREMMAVARLGGSFLFLDDPAYPPLLALLEDAPPVLALLGDPLVLKRRQVGVVGARSASAAGRRLAEELSAGLCMGGVVVTSGLARGIDAAAHTGALGAQGRTIAVVAGGLDQPYPPENAGLQARIAAEGGVVVSEAPLGTAPMARHFPRRNRIVAGLVLGLVVVEAAPRSGSLITARLALEAGRELFAVPGSPMDPRARGSNDLIRQGAHLTETAEDVLANLPAQPLDLPLFSMAPSPVNHSPAPVSAPARPESQAQILEMIGTVPVAVDDLVRRCQLSAPSVQAILLDLELSGLVECLPGNRVVRSVT
ncbi:DNA-processing protein DprA [Falsiroseomonas sp.]|uniref:DNA-processing protein DprA n=1 Tax=Falsiroseomonas sp. TaxID=2870721 RepID=UPI003F6E924F